jgi:CRP-like cAMP-binding protein
MIATNLESANHYDSSRTLSPESTKIKRSETRISMSDESSNLLLASLSPKYRAALLSRMRTVALPAREVMYEPDETPKFAHFLTGGIASIVGTMSSGASAEVGIWGKEGLVECFHLLGNARIPTRCFMQVEGTALRIPFKDLQREFRENDEMRDCVLQGVQSQGAILGQLAACNRLHEAEERLARWFLMVRDRIESDNFYLTQEFLAVMLGSRRTTVTAAAGALQRKGLIRYSRGRIHIVDSAGLEREACECYATVREIYLNFYGVAVT